MTNYSGMTVNERLFVAGLLDKFDDAVGRGDRQQIIDILTAVDISQAESTCNTILLLRAPLKQNARINSN